MTRIARMPAGVLMLVAGRSARSASSTLRHPLRPTSPLEVGVRWPHEATVPPQPIGMLR